MSSEESEDKLFSSKREKKKPAWMTSGEYVSSATWPSKFVPRSN